jgi:hypothetical protein
VQCEKRVKMKSTILGSIVFSSALASGVALAHEWADVSLTVVLADDEGASPNKPSQEEHFVVNPKNHGFSNFVLTIDTKRTTLDTKDFHPTLREVPKKEATLNVANGQFVPHVFAIRAGQTIRVRGQQNNVPMFSFFENQVNRPAAAPGQTWDVQTKFAEKAPCRIDCRIDPRMSAFVLVLDHPYTGISDGDGRIKIEKLPAGIPIHFKIWHEYQNRSIEDVVLNGNREKWVRGSTQFTFHEGLNDLGTLKIGLASFKK